MNQQHRGVNTFGEMPKILVNGSSNYSIIDSIEAENHQYPQTPVVLIHTNEPALLPESCECSPDKRRHSKSEDRRDSRPRRERRRSSGSSPSGRKHSRSKQTPVIQISPEALEKERRHRFVVSIVMGTFFFIVIASVLVVVITLTSQTHLIQNENAVLYGARRFQHQNVFPSTVTNSDDNVRKENEELMHSLSYNNHAHLNKSKLISTLAPQEVPY